MGRKTYESIPPRFRPLPGRLNVVLSRTESESKSKSTEPPPENVLWATSLTGAIDTLRSKGGVHEIFVIGGGEIYSQAMGVPGLVSRCFVTEVDEGKFATKDGKTVEFDTFFDHDLSGNGSGSGSGGWWVSVSGEW